jgi:3-oxoadipate enol-lactonase
VRGVANRLELDGVGLAYDAYGATGAPPMVLLHALGESRQDWPGIAERLAEDFLVITVDLRGHGDSDWPDAYSCRLMADDVAGLLDRLGLTAVTVLGHSLGGVVAYLLAERRPDLVERLVIEDICPPFHRDRPPLERPDDDLPFDWAAVVALRREAEQEDVELWDRLGSITAPTLLVGGGPESSVPAEKLQAVAEQIPVCELVEIPAGHYVHREKPAEFLAVVLGWLARQRR